MKQITLNSGKVIVTDPCYEPSNGYNRTLKNVLTGKWNCTVRVKDCGAWGKRIASLTIRHENYPKGKFDGYEGCAAVDSGQCGFFDPDYYDAHYEDNEWENKDSWYRRVSDMTGQEPMWGTIDDAGVVAESGYGDGVYEIQSIRDRSGYICALRLKFI